MLVVDEQDRAPLLVVEKQANAGLLVVKEQARAPLLVVGEPARAPVPPLKSPSLIGRGSRKIRRPGLCDTLARSPLTDGAYNSLHP